MISLHEQRFELDRPVQPPTSLASWYTQGHTDGFGDRLLMSDNTGATSFELLRFRPALTIVRGFERALRARVERQQFFRHPLFPAVRAVDHLDGGRVLALVSTYAPGRRLSEVFRDPRGLGLHPALAAWLVRQLVPALAELQRRGGGPHGVLTADRIVLTPEGSPVIVDHALGSALEQLYLPPARLWSDFGLIAPSTTGLVDARSDIVQLGLIVLSLCLGRRMTPDDYPSKLELLLDEFTDTVGRRSPKIAGPLRLWLERALRANGNLFTTAEQAQDGVADLSGLLDPQVLEHLLAAHAAHPVQMTEPPAAEAMPETIALDAAASALQDFPAEAAAPSPAAPAVVEGRAAARRTDRTLLVVCALLGVIVLAQAVVIARLLSRAPAVATAAAATVPVMIDSPRAGDAVMVDGRQVGVTPLDLKVGSAVRSIRVMSQAAPVLPVPSVPSEPAGSAAATKAAQPPPDPLKALAARQRSGGLRLVSPIELSVFEGERLLGSSADGPVVTTAGEHQLDLVNNALRYRTRQNVTIKTGEIVSLKVSPPDGRLSINASPWAQVWVDGRAVGDTPLANVAVPIGEHDVMFRHPQLGERHVTVLVRSGDSSRVSAAFGP
jgi:hypothetical protein